MARALRSLLAAIAVAVAAFAVSAPGAGAATTGGVGFRVDGVPGSQLEAGYITLEVARGGSAAGWFTMTNSGGATPQMRIYPADGLTGVTSGVVYGTAGDALTSAGSWLTPSVRSAAIAPGTERRIDFSVRVPPGAGSGDHVGSIVMEQNGRGSSTVSQVVRNVVPIRIVVPGFRGGQIRLRTAKIDELPGVEGAPAVFVGLRNDGDRLCAPQLDVSLKGPSEKGETVSRQLDAILPGDTIPFPLPWPRSIEPGSYVARVSSSGCGAPDSITVQLVAPDFDAERKAGGKPGVKVPTVETDAQPGATTFREGGERQRSSGRRTRRHDRDHKRDAGDVSAADANGAASSGGPTGGASGGFGSGARGGPGVGAGGRAVDGGAGQWLGRAASDVSKAAPEVLRRATIPLLFLLLVGLIFFVQEAIDRRDPKLALAPLHREPHLPFDPHPLRERAAVPSSSGLSPGS